MPHFFLPSKGSLSIVTIFCRLVHKLIQIIFMVLGKGLILVLGFEMENGLYLIEIEGKLLIMVMENRLMVIIHSIYSDKTRSSSILTTSGHQMQWM